MLSKPPKNDRDKLLENCVAPLFRHFMTFPEADYVYFYCKFVVVHTFFHRNCMYNNAEEKDIPLNEAGKSFQHINIIYCN